MFRKGIRNDLIPSIAVSGNVYVVWKDNTPGNDEVFYRRSTDGGATFGSTVNLSNTRAIAIYDLNNEVLQTKYEMRIRQRL